MSSIKIRLLVVISTLLVMGGAVYGYKAQSFCSLKFENVSQYDFYSVRDTYKFIDQFEFYNCQEMEYEEFEYFFGNFNINIISYSLLVINLPKNYIQYNKAVSFYKNEYIGKRPELDWGLITVLLPLEIPKCGLDRDCLIKGLEAHLEPYSNVKIHECIFPYNGVCDADVNVGPIPSDAQILKSDDPERQFEQRMRFICHTYRECGYYINITIMELLRGNPSYTRHPKPWAG